MKPLFGTLPLLTLAAIFPVAEAAVVYTESFPNSGGAKNFSTIGWFANVGSTATDWTSTSDVSSTSDAAVWTTAGIGGGIGYGFGALGSTALYWTTEPGSIAVNTLQTLSFYSNNAATTSSLRFVLKLDNGTPGDTADDFWVASATAFNSSSGGSSANWADNSKLESLAFATSAASWRDLTFTSGSLSLGAVRSVDLPAGNATSFGLFVSGGTVRFDEYAIAVVPEPSGATLLGVAACLLSARRKRAAAR